MRHLIIRTTPSQLGGGFWFGGGNGGMTSVDISYACSYGDMVWCDAHDLPPCTTFGNVMCVGHDGSCTCVHICIGIYVDQPMVYRMQL